QLVSVVKSTIETAITKNLDNVDGILSGWLGAEYGLIVIQLLESVNNSISVIYGTNLMNLTMRRNDVSTALKVKLIVIMLAICDDAMLPEILSESKEVGRLTKNLEKRQLGSSLYSAFRNTATDAFKIQVFSLVKLTGTRSAFETDEEKNKREFSAGENELLKQNK
ncbi:MAG: hypothetical protein RRY14_07115, partial [Hydrogenoanaerobacterium sp.]